MRQSVRHGLITLLLFGLTLSASAQAPAQPAKSATKAAVPARPPILDQVLATVNGEKITRGELINTLQAMGAQNADPEVMYKYGIDGIANKKLINQYLRKQPTLTVPEKDVDAEFADFEKQFKANGEDVHVALASHGVSVAEVREDFRDRLRFVKYLDAVATDPNLKKFVADNKDYYNKTQVQISHIQILVDAGAPAADKEKAKQKLLAIKQEIESGKITFANAANKYSEDDANKTSPRGGDIGYHSRRGIIEQFASVAFALPKGKISDPVETPYGYHLILVTDRKEGTPLDFEQSKVMVKGDYAADLQERIVVNERKTAKITVEPMPADLFPKAPPQTAPAAPGQPAKKAATPPPSTAAPK
jgi:peptidyl-prolyl cis-trans isomerase C